MSGFVEVSKASELKDGTMEDMSVDGREVLLARVGGKYYATDNRCPHMGGKLAQGKLEGTVVTCPLHGSQFDLRDGQVVRWLKKSGWISTVSKAIKPPKPLVMCSVKVEGDRILIEIS